VQRRELTERRDERGVEQGAQHGIDGAGHGLLEREAHPT
jgi:hypothetical protein